MNTLRDTAGIGILRLGKQGLAFVLSMALLFVTLPPGLSAQDQDADAAPPPSQGAQAPAYAQQSPEQLQRLVAPIALYPDSLIALILPASTTSADVVLAARFLSDGGEPAEIDNQPWGESVKSLAHYPVVVKWMDDNLAWTRQMGEVFEAQPADVMNTIQRLRAQARAAGLLTDTSQQKIVMQEDQICIVPAEPDVIYVPRYDPEILWMRRPYSGTFISFGIGFGIGNWLYYDCDWPGRSIWVQHRAPGWVYHPGWRRPVNEVHVVLGTPWHPDPRHARPGRPMHQPMSMAVHPRGPEDSPRDMHGRIEHPTTPNAGRPGRAVVPAQRRDAPMPAQHAVTPPQQVQSRPQPVASPQSSREQQHGHRAGENRPPLPSPHPPSHTPVMAPAAQVQAQSPAPAPATLQRGDGGQNNGSATRAGRAQ